VARPTNIPATSAPGNLARLADGRLALAWNPADCGRSELHLAISRDDGRTWGTSVALAKGRQVTYLLERRDEPLVIPLAAPERLAGSAPAASGRAVSQYRVRLPYISLPASALVLETSAGVFERAVRVLVERAPTDRRRDRWTEEIAAAVWRHANPETRAPALGLSIPVVDAQQLLLVDEGDNSPLPVTSVSLLLPSARVRFFRPADTSLSLVYGWPGLGLPRYDLALLAGAVLGSPAEEIAMADERPFEPPAPPVAMPPAAFWGVLILAVVVLLALVVRLVGKGSGAGIPTP